MIVSVSFELPLWLVVLMVGYVLAGLIIGLLAWRDGGRESWAVSHWATAITVGPIVALEVWIETVVAGRNHR